MWEKSHNEFSCLQFDVYDVCQNDVSESHDIPDYTPNEFFYLQASHMLGSQFSRHLTNKSDDKPHRVI